MSVTWLERNHLFPTVLKKLEKVNILLDIGCGVRPQKYIKPSVHICCEPFKQYVNHLQTMLLNQTDCHYVVIQATWEEVVKLFPPKSVDTIFLLDVIEHLEKAEATKLLEASLAIVRRQLAVFTPLGFLPQKYKSTKDAWGFDGGQWQEHKSGWEPQDFDASWDIYVANGFHQKRDLATGQPVLYGAMWAISTLPK